MDCAHHWIIVNFIGACKFCGAHRWMLEDHRRNVAAGEGLHGNQAFGLRLRVQRERLARYGGSPFDARHLPPVIDDSDWIKRSAAIEAMLNVAGRNKR